MTACMQTVPRSHAVVFLHRQAHTCQHPLCPAASMPMVQQVPYTLLADCASYLPVYLLNVNVHSRGCASMALNSTHAGSESPLAGMSIGCHDHVDLEPDPQPQ